MSNYNERTTAEATKLAERLAPIAIERNRLMAILATPPICGKPGNGFRARAKAQRQLRAIEQSIININAEIDRWVSQNNKASKPTRANRRAFFDATLRNVAIAGYVANVLATIDPVEDAPVS